MNPSELMNDLTEPQKQAVTHGGGPLLVVAGAGSGKTRVITRRVAYLISQGVDPGAILAITFTNKAAGEMKQRVAATLGGRWRDWGKLFQAAPMICTFHSLCLRILKHFASTIGLPPNFAVFDSADQNKLMKEALSSLGVSTTMYPPGSVHATISNAKNKLLTASDFAKNAGDPYQRTVANIYAKYQALLKANNALDFDDLLLETANAFRRHHAVLEELQDRFLHILVDEYQDTNHAQYIIAHALARKHRNIVVVGDPDQSIYAWRGADVANILDFEKDYPDATVVRLEQNYRSTKTVLAIASKLIANNVHRKEKALWTENPQGERAELYMCQDEHDEADQIANRLVRLHEKDNIPWNAMAIFYRMNSLSRVMEESLRRRRIPYQIARGVEFYNRKEIKDVLAYLRTVANPFDEVSLTRIVNVPTRGIGDAAVKLLTTHAVAAGISLWEAMGQAEKVEGLSTRAVKSVAAFIQLIEKLRPVADAPAEMFVEKGRIRTLMEAVLARSGLEEMLKKLDPTKENEIPNVNELVTSAAEYDRDYPEGTLDDYLSAVSLTSDIDRLEGSEGAVTMMTLHAAKGLEFPVVAIIGLEEGCLPHARAREDARQLEEERRLCFVGITRAQERLLLSNAAWRTIRGQRQRVVASPFLQEMPQDMLETTDRADNSYDPGPRVEYDRDWRSQSFSNAYRRRGRF
jgi:DNA helicase II / ATP-dependent DNA helicase PcrA